MHRQRLRGASRRALRLTTVLGTLALVVAATTAGAPPDALPPALAPAGEGRGTERLWLLGGLGFALTAAGLVALAAARSRVGRRR
ncbi:hypothetical protein ACFYT4_22050 [Streptomyces sp. NPDC004609]|uniref:hypothetical protein n=1 Tax=Streptomyces sp. NPDC004609 TaxID=3364704 RepID=UPI0036C009EE